MNNTRKIVITGAAGFLGGRTAKFLASHFPNDQIYATSRRATRSNELEDHHCKFLKGDLCQPDFCNKLTSQTDIVIHCAALSSPYGNYESFFNLIISPQKHY